MTEVEEEWGQQEWQAPQESPAPWDCQDQWECRGSQARPDLLVSRVRRDLKVGQEQREREETTAMLVCRARRDRKGTVGRRGPEVGKETGDTEARLELLA